MIQFVNMESLSRSSCCYYINIYFFWSKEILQKEVNIIVVFSMLQNMTIKCDLLC